MILLSSLDGVKLEILHHRAVLSLFGKRDGCHWGLSNTARRDLLGTKRLNYSLLLVTLKPLYNDLLDMHDDCMVAHAIVAA